MYFLSAGTITKSPHSILQEKFLFNSDVSTVPSPRPSANLGLKTSSILESETPAPCSKASYFC